jgi:hypothetical protein
MNIEELKLIVELLKGVSSDALTGAILYMVLGFLKAPIVCVILVWGAVKIVGKLKAADGFIKVKDIG